jgi:hypothetical protein
MEWVGVGSDELLHGQTSSKNGRYPKSNEHPDKVLFL